jgi:endoglucanase
MAENIRNDDLRIIGEAWANSNQIVNFSKDGWSVAMWGTKYPRRVLRSSWDSYARNFITNGRVFDPQFKNTTSEGQAYALLRAVWINDKPNFEKIYTWSNKNLRQENNLYSWRYSNESGREEIERSNATDADQDIALALLFAYKQWGNEKYLEDAKKIIKAIADDNVFSVNGEQYVGAGTWANTDTQVVINPSYLSPAHYRIFAQVDSTVDWQRIADTSYSILRDCTRASLDKESGVLPPEWCALEKKTLKVVQSQSPGVINTEYGFNAFRVPLRISMDYAWFKSPEALQYAKELRFLGDTWSKDKKLYVSYTHDGKAIDQYESAGAYAGNLGYFMLTNSQEAKTVYEEKILNKFYEDTDRSYWEDPNNYYTQNIAWFATALYGNMLPNLWEN